MKTWDLNGQVALVTGSTKGIGFAIARLLGNLGATVALNGRSSQDTGRVQEVLDAVKSAKIRTNYYQCNISSHAEVKSMVGNIVSDFGKIDILINNAGITGIPKPISELPEEEWDRVIKTDLYGTFFVMKYVLPYMIKQNYGRIVNISSIAGKEGNPNMVHYCAAKHGVVGLTKSAAREVLEHNIRINAVCPVLIETELLDGLPEGQVELLKSKIPVGRLGKTEEVADLVAFLVSSEAVNFITGQAMDLSGGRADY
ncbi:MAG: SDR family oxidoreductase [Deltaproteobacteria bacterium]|nr:SDR family oxidoreductase [Deltaproteobacteria bacterium]MBW1860990.1 SDR family oxidoreductase [Deltaproteobacteria bacterium]